MRIFVATLATETNTFTPVATDMSAFEEAGIRRRGHRDANPASICLMLDAISEMAGSDGHEVVEGIGAVAQPAGPVLRQTYESLRDELLDNLVGAAPVDAVILILHGAMVAEGYDDCEGDILARVRQIVGSEVAVGVELDPHCHLTEAMVEAADILVCFKEYPHTDTAEIARDVYRLTIATARSELNPSISVADCRMVGLWPTTSSPIRELVQTLRDLEKQPGILSVSFAHGFPWGDVAEAGAKVLVITDNDPESGDALAASLREQVWAIRQAAIPPTVSPGEAFDTVASADHHPLVLADMSDNPGGGAPGDSTFLLAEALKRNISNLCFGCLWDPEAVEYCFAAGEGARLALSMGGKAGAFSGRPVTAGITVSRLLENHSQTVFGSRQSFGRSVCVTTAQGVEIVLTSIRQQVIGLDALESFGLNLAEKKAIIVKSAQHFSAAYAPLASAIVYVDSPGALSHDFARLPYRKRSLQYWPRVEDPFAEEAA